MTTRPTRRSTHQSILHSLLQYLQSRTFASNVIQYNIHHKRITIIYIKIFPTAISMAKKKKKKLCLPKRLVTSLQARTGRPVALKTNYLTGRDDTLPQNDISPATSPSSRKTPALTAKVDNHPENQRQRRQPSMNDLTLNERSTWSLNSSSPPRDAWQYSCTLHEHSTFNAQIFTILNLGLKLYTSITMHRHPPRLLVA